MEVNPKATRFKRSLDAQLLYERLVKAAVGELITYEELSAIVGRDVRNDCYSALGTARDIAKGDRIVFDCVTNEGLKRLDDAQTVSAGAEYISRAKNAAKRGARIVAASRYENLGPADRVKHNTTLSVLGAMELFGKPSSVAKVEKQITQADQNGRLSLDDTLKLFGKKE